MDENEDGKRAYEEEMARHKPPRRVVVTGIEMPFWSMVSLLVQFSLAAIPTLVILGLMVALFRFLMAYLFKCCGP